MTQENHIIFYTHVFSPYCHRVEIALKVVKAEYTPYKIDFLYKPAWFVPKVNPAGKIPVITYGPKGAPEDPPPEAARINESLVILEFLADLYPEANLLPSDPVLAAQARLFILAYEPKGPEAFINFFFKYQHTENAEKAFIDSLELVQSRLPPTGFAVGEFSNADISVAPFVVRAELFLSKDWGTYPKGDGSRIFELYQSPKFARLKKYVEDIKGHPGFQAAWDEPRQTALWAKAPIFKRE
ncbi:thioredoxin-like protein [Trametes polyzona]|nr:thioredoxin-like protein [Trametes polyzona]